MGIINDTGIVIAVDFDGTLCQRAWPEIGEPNMGLIRYLIAARNGGDKVILWTCRHDELLANAIAWCKNLGLEFDAVNDNLPERIEMYGNNSRKVSADIYIDDQAIGMCYPRGKQRFAVFGTAEFTVSATVDMVWEPPQKAKKKGLLQRLKARCGEKTHWDKTAQA